MNNTTKEAKLLKKKIWTAADLNEWLRFHTGEYIAKRVETRKRMEDPKYAESTARAIAEIESSLYTIEASVDSRWILERQAALMAIVPKSIKAIDASNDDMLTVLLEREPDAEEMIRKISDLAAEGKL